jgi:hypothetical protein
MHVSPVASRQSSKQGSRQGGRQSLGLAESRSASPLVVPFNAGRGGSFDALDAKVLNDTRKTVDMEAFAEGFAGVDLKSIVKKDLGE